MTSLGSARPLAALVSYGAIGDAFHVDDVEAVLKGFTSLLLSQRASFGQAGILLSKERFSSALGSLARAGATDERARHALRWFDESSLVSVDGAAFGTLVKAEAARREELVGLRLLEHGVALDDGFVQRYRRRLLTRFLWDRAVRALPALFLLAAAVLAVTMVFRLVKLPS